VSDFQEQLFLMVVCCSHLFVMLDDFVIVFDGVVLLFGERALLMVASAAVGRRSGRER
jgi:hypothetical protein